MGRYAQSIIIENFPELSEDGDLIYVAIRNPKTLPIDQLTPSDSIETDEDGKPVDKQAGKDATYGIIANLIHDWHVYDGNADGDSDPLPLPATAEHIAALPFEITKWLMEQIGSVLSPPQ